MRPGTPCNCCTSMASYIEQHLDPEGLTSPDEDPAAVLATFQECFDGELEITVEDVRRWLLGLAEARTDDAALTTE